MLSKSETKAKFSAGAHVCVFCRFLLQFVDVGVKLKSPGCVLNPATFQVPKPYLHTLG